MSKPKAQSPLDDKPEFAHLDHVDTLTAAGDAKGADLGEGLYKSRWDELSVWQAMWTFRRSSFYTFMVYTAYIIDGYEVGPDEASVQGCRLTLSGDHVGQYHCQSRFYAPVWRVE